MRNRRGSQGVLAQGQGTCCLEQPTPRAPGDTLPGVTLLHSSDCRVGRRTWPCKLNDPLSCKSALQHERAGSAGMPRLHHHPPSASQAHTPAAFVSLGPAPQGHRTHAVGPASRRLSRCSRDTRP